MSVMNAEPQDLQSVVQRMIEEARKDHPEISAAGIVYVIDADKRVIQELRVNG
jgi:hypothetical protein